MKFLNGIVVNDHGSLVFNDTWWKLLLLKLFLLLQGGITLELYQKTQRRNSTRESIWNRFESVSVTAIGISLALLLSGQIAKELRIALYLDCELVSQLKPFRVFYFNRHWYVFPFSFPSGSRSNIQCMLSDEERNEESYQLMVEKQQEICRGNYPSKKSP